MVKDLLGCARLNLSKIETYILYVHANGIKRAKVEVLDILKETDKKTCKEVHCNAMQEVIESNNDPNLSFLFQD